MCAVPDLVNSASSSTTASSEDHKPHIKDMNNLTVETKDSMSILLELAANNDISGFKQLTERDPSAVDEIGLWYGRQRGSRQMVLEHRTALMVAATYGSVDVLKFILSLSEADVNRSCGPDKSTALHCAASGGSVNADEVVKLLLFSGADPNSLDVNGCRPADVIVVAPKLSKLKASLEVLLANDFSFVSGSKQNLRISTSCLVSDSPSPKNGSPSSIMDSIPSPTMKPNDHSLSVTSEKKEYPIDPSLPDIKNGIYSTDEFRMFSLKVRPCSRAYSHDWTECPFVHPGENARRRDPRKFHYSCVPCPDFRKGGCRRGDLCEYAHGVFECWLHPAQYRTRLCKDGESCMRRVCFFAHTPEELRPLYMSTGSAVPSPRSTAASVMDMSVAMNLYPPSPSSVSVMSPSPFASPMSPSVNGVSHSSMAWPQPNVPTLHLPHASRLRSSCNARDITSEDYNMLQEMQNHHEMNELLSQQHLNSPPVNLKTLTPSNLEDLFSAEITRSPHYADQAIFSPSHKLAIRNQFQQQQSMLSAIKTNPFSPNNIDHPMLQNSYAIPSSGRMSPKMEPISPGSARFPVLSQREKYQQLHSRSSLDIGFNTSELVESPMNSWTKWGSPNGKLDWGLQGDELLGGGFSRRIEPGNNGGEEPDVSWVKSLVKESPPEIKDKLVEAESSDHSALGARLEQMQLNHFFPN